MKLYIVERLKPVEIPRGFDIKSALNPDLVAQEGSFTIEIGFNREYKVVTPISYKSDTGKYDFIKKNVKMHELKSLIKNAIETKKKYKDTKSQKKFEQLCMILGVVDTIERFENIEEADKCAKRLFKFSVDGTELSWKDVLFSLGVECLQMNYKNNGTLGENER